MLSVVLRYCACLVICTALIGPVQAQDTDAPIQQVLQAHAEIIQKSSRRTIGPAIDALANSGMADAKSILERWQNKEMWFNEETGIFVFAQEGDDDVLLRFDVAAVPPLRMATRTITNSSNPIPASVG